MRKNAKPRVNKSPNNLITTTRPKVEEASNSGWYMMAIGATLLTAAAGVAIHSQCKRKEEKKYNERLLSAYVDESV